MLSGNFCCNVCSRYVFVVLRWNNIWCQTVCKDHRRKSKRIRYYRICIVGALCYNPNCAVRSHDATFVSFVFNITTYDYLQVSRLTFQFRISKCWSKRDATLIWSWPSEVVQLAFVFVTTRQHDRTLRLTQLRNRVVNATETQGSAMMSQSKNPKQAAIVCLTSVCGRVCYMLTR